MTRHSAQAVAPETKVVGRRAAAFLVDNVVIGVLILLCAIPLLLGVTIGYYALLEGYRGQTVGKMLFGLEVIRDDTGAVPGPKAAALRAVMLLLADAQFFGIVGLAAILLTERRQRIGDMAAGTLVVRKARGVRR